MLKVLNNNIVVDIIESPCYVSYQKKNNLIVSVSKRYAQGVVSSDGESIFHIEGTSIEGFEDCTTVILVEITEEEAAEIEQILDSNEELLDLPEEQILPRAPLMELQVNYELLLRRIEVLEEENQRLRERE